MSLIKHKLELTLTDKEWFSYVSFKEKSSLNSESSVTLKPLFAINTLSLTAELLFSVLVSLVALIAMYLAENIVPLLALLTTLGLYLLLFCIKRIALIKKYGFRKKKAAVVSQNSLYLDKGSVKNKQSDKLDLSRNNIKEITVNYTFSYRQKRHLSTVKTDKRAAIHQIKIDLIDGREIIIDGMRVSFFNLLYLFFYFNYPLSFIRTPVGGMKVLMIMLFRLFSLSALGSGLVYIISQVSS